MTWLKRLARRLFMLTHRDELRALERRILRELGSRTRSHNDAAIGALDALELLGLKIP